jgi:hypothetical protein
LRFKLKFKLNKRKTDMNSRNQIKNGLVGFYDFPTTAILKTILPALCTLCMMIGCVGAESSAIDRHALVTRHNIEWNDLQGQIPLGNGEFCFNADATGLQTFGGNSMSHWGWHSFPLPAGWTADRIPATGTFQKGHDGGASDGFSPDQAAIRSWLFDNPHKMNLGRLRLCGEDGQELQLKDISDLSRTLDLWSGKHFSSYQINGVPVRVGTCVHPTLDAVAVRIESPLIASGNLQVVLDFPYPTLNNTTWVGDFSQFDGHTTEMTRPGESRVNFLRVVDGTRYHTSLSLAPGGKLNSRMATVRKKLVIQKAEFGDQETWLDVTDKVAACVVHDVMSISPNYKWLGDPLPGKFKKLRMTYVLGGEEKTVEVAGNTKFSIQSNSPHSFLLSGQGKNRLEFTCAFSPTKIQDDLPTFGKASDATGHYWKQFWSTGGAVDLSESQDPRWKELERRIVLSQYHMAAQSAGSYPSAEIGLMGLDPWRSQFHMEMAWWHLAHYALWDRLSMSDRALGCYQQFMPSARALATQLGYKGLKWPKSAGPEGRSAPWVGNQVLLWKQPHPIFFAELEYRLRPTPVTIDKWADIVEGTAENMADYVTLDEKTGLYSLVPAMPPSEQGITRDTVFDLAYWRWGLDKAQEWRQRKGLPREPHWDDVRQNLAPLPVADGVFVHSAEWHDTYTNRAWEHPDPIGVLGMLPPMEGVDGETAHRTVLKVWQTWDWNRCWGWDFPWMAMAAARVGEPQIAIEALLKDAGNRNSYDVRGVNIGGPCPYLPGNGGVLYAVAMMAAGWDGCPETPAPGFPDDGSWTVKWEGLKKAP